MLIPQEPPPRGKTFALHTVEHMLDKLAWEIRQLESASSGNDPRDVRFTAFNCAVTAWHISDWAWEELSPEVKQKLALTVGASLSSVGEFQSYLRKQCHVLHLCRQIATGSKHKVVSRGNDEGVTADLGWDVQYARAGMMRAGDPLRRYKLRAIIFEGNVEREALDVFKEALAFWERSLGEWFLIESRLYVEGKPIVEST